MLPKFLSELVTTTNAASLNDSAILLRRHARLISFGMIVDKKRAQEQFFHLKTEPLFDLLLWPVHHLDGCCRLVGLFDHFLFHSRQFRQNINYAIIQSNLISSPSLSCPLFCLVLSMNDQATFERTSCFIQVVDVKHRIELCLYRQCLHHCFEGQLVAVLSVQVCCQEVGIAF